MASLQSEQKKRPIRVGVICSTSKFGKNKLAELAVLGKERGITVSPAPLSLGRDIAQQCEEVLGGQPDVIFGKFTDHLVLLDTPGEKGDVARAEMSRWRSFEESHPEVLVLDPLAAQVALTSRTGVASGLESIATRTPLLSAAKFVQVGESGVSPVEQVRSAGLKFPIVVKPEQACGSAESHLMGIAFRPEGLAAFALPFFAQEYYNHNSIVHKIYVVEPHYFCAQRTSLENFPTDRVENLMFDSQLVNHRLQVPVADPPPAELIETLVAEIRSVLGLSIFGFDLIRNAETDLWSVIDVNFFPGFNECSSECHAWMLNLVEARLSKL